MDFVRVGTLLLDPELLIFPLPIPPTSIIDTENSHYITTENHMPIREG